MIKVYKMKRKGKETLLKEYKTIKGAIDFIEKQNNYESILYAIENNEIVAFQSFIPRKSFLTKLLDLLN